MKLVLFDVDGTLVDSQNIIVAAQGMAFSAQGLEPPSRERSLSIVGLSLVEAFTVLVGPKGPIEGLVEAYKDAFTPRARIRPTPSRSFPAPQHVSNGSTAVRTCCSGSRPESPAAGLLI